MDGHASDFYKDLLMYSEYNPNGKKEQDMIDLLEGQLFLSEKGEPLDIGQLAKAHHKISRISCFSLRYSGIVDFLDRYHERYLLREMNRF